MKLIKNNILTTFIISLAIFGNSHKLVAQEFESFWKINKCGFKKLNGDVIVEPKYDVDKSSINGLALVGTGSYETGYKYGFIDISGKEVIELKFDEALSFSDGLAAVSLGKNNWGFIDKTGEVVIAGKYFYVNGKQTSYTSCF